MIYLIIFGNLFAAVAASFLLVKLIWAIPSIRKFQEIATYNEIIRNASDSQIDEHPPLASFTDSYNAYLFEAVKLLVRHEPSHASTILTTLEPDLSQLRNDMIELGGDAEGAFYKAAEDCVQYIMAVAPTSWIGSLWQKASHEKDQLWLFECVFRDNIKPIALHEESQNGIYVECDKTVLFLKVSDKEYDTLKSIRKYLLANQFLKFARDPDYQVSYRPIPEVYVILADMRDPNWKRDSRMIDIDLVRSLFGKSQQTVSGLLESKARLIAREELGR